MGIYGDYVPLDERDRYGHQKYQAQCTVCGAEAIGRKKDLDRITVCRHVLRKTDIPSRQIDDRRIARIFSDMIKRCYDEGSRDHRWYGAKGIRVCDEWQLNPASFAQWFLSQEHGQIEPTVDRIDATMDYSPSNCRLVSREENSRWKVTTNAYTINGETLSGRQWSGRIGRGVNYVNRYAAKYGHEEALKYIRQSLEQRS